MIHGDSHTKQKIPVLQVANTKKETVFKWLKDDVLYETEKLPDLEKGVCELLIPKVPCSKESREKHDKQGLSNDLWILHDLPVCILNYHGLQRKRIGMQFIFYHGTGFTYLDVFYLQLSKKDHGEYKATLKDERGQDVSILEIAGKGRIKPPPFC